MNELASVQMSSLPQGGVAVVFGASGGVCAALVEHLRASDHFVAVVALSRRSAASFDLTDEASIAHAVASVAALGELRLVIDATGFLHDDAQGPEKTWSDLDAAKLARAFALNAIGPALLMKHALPALAPQGKAVFATLSARVGSIGDNHLGGWYGYRASKAALNQLVRTAAIDLSAAGLRLYAWRCIRARCARPCPRPSARMGWRCRRRRRQLRDCLG